MKNIFDSNERYKSLHCSFCNNILLDHIGMMTRRDCYSLLFQLYHSSEAFLNYWIEIINVIILRSLFNL